MNDAPTPTPPTTKTLSELFPEFKVYTKEQLAALTPEQLVSVLQSLGRIKTSISSESIRLETQLANVEQQIESTQNSIRTEFNVTSVEELEALQKSLLGQIDEQYKALSEALPQ